MRFLYNVNLSVKFILIVVFVCVPIAYLGYQHISKLASEIADRNSSIQGIELQYRIRPLLRQISEYRSLVAADQNEGGDLKGRITETAQIIDGLYAELVDFMALSGNGFLSEEAIAESLNTWNQLNQTIYEMSSYSSYTKLTRLLDSLQLGMKEVAMNSKLMIDKDLDIVFLRDLTSGAMPKLLEDLGKIHAIASNVVAENEMSSRQETQIISLQGVIAESLRGVQYDLQSAFAHNPDLEELLAEQLSATAFSVKVYSKTAGSVFKESFLLENSPEDYLLKGDDVFANGTKLYDIAMPRMEEILKERVSKMRATLAFSSIFSAVLVAVALSLILIIWGNIRKRFSRIISIFNEIENGNLDTEINTRGTTEFSKIFQGLSRMQTSISDGIDSREVQASENRRIRICLDSVDANVVVVDTSCSVIYANDCANNLFRDMNLGEYVENFDETDLVGSNLASFLGDTGCQHVCNGPFTNAGHFQLELGQQIFSVVASPVANEDGSPMGAVLQITVLTSQVAMQEEIQALVAAALAGDMSSRIALDGKDGFYSVLSTGINQLLDASGQLIQDTGRVLSAMSNGDLTNTIESEYEGIFDELKTDTNNTIVQLTGIVTKIVEVGDLVNSSALEISSGNTELSNRTHQQAASLDATSQSMELMTESVKQNAANANRANGLAQEARDQAKHGSGVIKEAVLAMKDIDEASTKIADIIGVIDEITFQTNLLALNASVEAARAGTEGRGFAVVATEVRSLAGRTAESAKQIKDLIDDSVNKVRAGSELVNRSGMTLDKITGSVDDVTDIVGKITEVCQEQESDIEQVNEAVLSMNKTTHQNNAVVKQSANEVESLTKQSDELRSLMAFFTVDDDLSDAAQTEAEHALRHEENNVVYSEFKKAQG